MRFLIAAAVAALFLAPAARAQADTQATATPGPAGDSALRRAADYASETTPLINEATALMTEMVDLSARYLAGFTDPPAYEQDRAALAAALAALGARIETLRARAGALADPPPGPYAARGLELKRYVARFAADIADMKATLDRLPRLVDAGDADGFDAARADLFRYSSNVIRAENAMLAAGQTTTPIGHPEFHHVEAMKNVNLVVAELIDVLQRAGLDATADRISDHHKGIFISLDACAALADRLKAQIAAQAPAAKAEADALFDAYRAAIDVERRIGAALGDYVPIAREIAGGAEPASFKPRLEAVEAAFAPLIAERQAALQAKQAAALAFAAAAK